MSEQILSLTSNKGRALTLFASLLTAMVLLFGLGMRTAETQTTPYYYEVQDLGTLPGGSYSYPYDINDSGQVVGCADTASGQSRAFFYKDGELKDLGTLGGNNSCAYGVNTSGQVVGYSETATSGKTHAFLYDSTNGMKDLGTLGGTNSHAYGINKSGQVVGYSDASDVYNGNPHAFLYDSTNGMKDISVPGSPWLGNWPWGSSSYAYDINDSGQVVGETNSHAFLYNIGTKTIKDLGVLGGGWHSEAWGINTSGQAVGLSYYNGGSYHAFLYSGNGPMQDLGDLTSGDSSYSWAFDINDSGQVVGYSELDYYTYSPSAFLYQNEEMIDLNTRLNPDNTGTVWTLSLAAGINNNGQIVVNGSQDISTSRALLLTPSDTPPPSDTTPPKTTITSQPPIQTNSKTASFSFTSDETGATFECSNDNQTWTICTSPYNYSSTPLQDGSHNFSVRAKDAAAGNVDKTPASYSWTVDTTAPTVGSISPAKAATGVALTANAEATFSEAIDPATLSTSTFTLKKGGTAEQVSGQVSYNDTNKKATLDPGSDLEANTTYTATIISGSNGLKDQAGNALGQDYSWTFTTIAPPPDTTKPTVLSLLATDLSGNVPLRKTSFKASFSEKMKTSTLNTTNFKLFKCSSTKDLACTTQITATDAPVTASADGLSATLNPYGTTSTLLAKNTKYKVVVSTGAQDLAGNALAAENVSYFTTGST